MGRDFHRYLLIQKQTADNQPYKTQAMIGIDTLYLAIKKS